MGNFPLWPDQASSFAAEYDLLFIIESLIMVFFAVLVVGMILYFGIKYRRGSPASRKNPLHHHGPAEYGSIVFMIFLCLIAFAWAASLYARMYTTPANALEIFVMGKQWMWHLQHSNGVRENNELHVPVGRPVKLTMISQDVLHAFFVPAFRIKKDVLPGRYTDQWFVATKTGKFHLFCAEYCGTQHSEMGGWVYVMEPADYQAWLARGGSQGPEAGGPTPPVTMEDKGKQLYAQLSCGNCHDPDGMQRGPSLAGLYGKDVRLKTGQVVKADNVYLRRSILEPSDQVAEKFQQVMPSYKDQLTEEQVLDLIAYIRTLGGTPNPNAELPTTPPAAGPEPMNTNGRPAAPPATANKTAEVMSARTTQASGDQGFRQAIGQMRKSSATLSQLADKLGSKP